MTQFHRQNNTLPWLQAAAIGAAVLFIYLPGLRGGWLWDDNALVTENPLMKDAAGLWKIWTHPGQSIEYYPLTFTLEWFEWHLGGLDPAVYRAVTIALHLANALLVWRLFVQLGLRLAWCGALFFAVHPLQVDSVAWVAETKNTLSLLFLLLAMNSWLDFDRMGRRGDYLLALAFFVLALLAKLFVIMFPAVVLLHGWWRRGCIRRIDLVRILPFCLVAAPLVLINSSLARGQIHSLAVPQAGVLPRGETTAAQAILLFERTLLPLHLRTVYPNGLATPLPSGAIVFVAILALVMGVICSWRRDWGRAVLFGLGFFLLNLLPVLAFIFADTTRMIWSLDHLEYISTIGPIGLVVAVCGLIEAALPHSARCLVTPGLLIVAAVLAWGSQRHAALYRDPLAYWQLACQANPGSDILRIGYGEALGQNGRIPDAIQQFQAAIRLNPSSANAHADLAKAMRQTGRIPEAVAECREVVKLLPNDAGAHYELANALVLARRLPEAVGEYQTTLQLDPHHAPAHYAMGGILLAAHHYPEAIRELERAAQIAPDLVEVHSALGEAYYETGSLHGAIAQFEIARCLKPADPWIAQVIDRLRTAEAAKK